MQPIDMVEIWRGTMLECVHRGHAVVCDAKGDILLAWGNPDQQILPRSACKMVQALPLLESGAAKGLNTECMALACASHQGAALHIERVGQWLSEMGAQESDLRCGVHAPWDAEQKRLCQDGGATQLHNNCSGKHAGFVMLNRHLGAGPDYVETDHPVQTMVRNTFEELIGEDSPGYGIDGCSAPNFGCTVHGLGRAMAFFANAHHHSGARAQAAAQLTQAMMAHPDLVAGEGRACTELMRAATQPAVIKTGAEGVYSAILPEQGLGVAVKITDGAKRASECVIAAILVKLGVLPPDHPATLRRMQAPQFNARKIETGLIRPVPGVFA